MAQEAAVAEAGEIGFAAEAGGAMAAGGMGAMEGAELGAFGGPVGIAAGAAIGGLGGLIGSEAASLMFRNRESSQQQSTFLDARSLNNQNQGVRPLQPRLHRFHEEAASGSGSTPSYFNIATREPSAEVMRPTAAPTARAPSARSAQTVIDEVAQPVSGGELLRHPLFRRNRGAPSRSLVPPSDAIQGEPNPGMLANRAPNAGYSDLMKATAAPTASSREPRRNKRTGGYSGSPYAFPMSGAPVLPGASRNRSRAPVPVPKPKPAPKPTARRNRGPPTKSKKDD
jgi:hypothetical protein